MQFLRRQTSVRFSFKYQKNIREFSAIPFIAHSTLSESVSFPAEHRSCLRQMAQQINYRWHFAHYLHLLSLTVNKLKINFHAPLTIHLALHAVLFSANRKLILPIFHFVVVCFRPSVDE